ncbi:MAG TPA: hypothetical protein VLC09_00290 [Polyangiaceae bacterium]|nr:hypothetical protein [Polyangiaceae bacterium]
MLTKALTLSALALSSLAFGVGLVSAQEATASSESAPSAEAMKSKATTVVSSLDQASQSIGRMLREARTAKDVVKAYCLDDKLSQVDVAKRSAAERADSLNDALATGNMERAQHDFEVIGALEERANGLTAEAQQCIGEEKGYAGGSSLKVTIDPTIPQNDTALPPPSPATAVLAPPQTVRIPDQPNPISPTF